MKTILSIFLFAISFSANDVEIYEAEEGAELYEMQENICPSRHEKAEKELKEYLAKEKTIEDLNRYEVQLDQTSHERIVALDSESDSVECQRFLDNFPDLKEESEYSNSIYKVANHYFILRYRFLENNKFKWESTSIINSDYKVLAVALDFG